MACEGLVFRNSIMAIVSEDTAGTLKAVSAATSFVPLRPGLSVEPGLETLESDELLDDIGMSKSDKGKESPAMTHSFYLRNTATDGFPELGPMYLSAFGSSISRTSEPTITNSTTTTITVADSSVFKVGEALLVADTTNGHFIRNISSIDSTNNILTLNFQLGTAPSTNAAIEKNYGYRPDPACRSAFSTWLYTANGGAIQAIAGCQVQSLSLTLPANGYADGSFSLMGTKYHFNPINITSSNTSLDFVASGITHTANIDAKIYRQPEDFIDEIKSKMDAITANSVNADVYTITYASHGSNEGKYTISTSGTGLQLLWQSGSNSASSIGTALNFDTSADDVAATSYTSDNEETYTADYTPTYDSADKVILKNCDLFIGSQTDNYQRKASTVSLEISTPLTDIDDLTNETGVFEKRHTSRDVILNATIILEKHEAGLFDKFINNTALSVMVNCGPKDSEGNWLSTKAINIYLGNATILTHNVSGDEVVVLELSIKGHVTSSLKDIYLNFC